jgi:hypothetical protein
MFAVPSLLWLAFSSTVVHGSEPPVRPSQPLQPPLCTITVFPAKDNDPTAGDPTGLELHLIPGGGTEWAGERVLPVGSSFQLPGDNARYLSWIEGRDLVSRQYVMWVINPGREPCPDRGALYAVGPAGTVSLDPRISIPKRTSLRLLSLANGFNRRVLDPAKMRSGAMMPAGAVVAGLHNDTGDEYVALSRPQSLGRAARLLVAPESPAGIASFLLVRVELSAGLRPEQLADVVMNLQTPEGKARHPDAFARGEWRLYAIWYDLESRIATVGAAGSTAWAPPVQVALHASQVETIDLRLQKLPTLTVDVSLPEPLASKDRKLVVQSLFPGRPPLRETAVADKTIEAVLANLPAEKLRVTLLVDAWEISQEVDLSPGKDETVVFAPRAVRVSGTVYRGSDPSRAFVAFQQRSGHWVETSTDANGRYDLAVLAPLCGARVRLAGLDSPFYDVCGCIDREDRQIDFHLPSNALRVEVRDARTGEGIDGAQVLAHVKGNDGQSQAVPLKTGPDGTVALPPCRPGHLHLQVRAEGFASREVDRDVTEKTTDESIVVDLLPEADVVDLVVALPDGTPAADAAVAVAMSAELPPSWGEACDGAGHVAVPRDAGALIAVRHPKAGALVAPWLPGKDQASMSLALPPPAPPLEIAVVDATGRPLPRARITLWVGGVRLGQILQRWLLPSSVPNADNNGLWRAVGLPALPIAVVACATGSQNVDDLLLTGALDSLRTPLSPPWPAPLRLVAVR